MHADSLTSVPELIQALGGPTKFARLLKLKGASTASEMKRSGNIGVGYWDAIIAAAPGEGLIGLDYSHLVRMHAKPAAAGAVGNVEAGR